MQIKQAKKPNNFGYMKGTIRITYNIVSPDPELWDCELGIAYNGEDGPVYWKDHQSENKTNGK